MYFIKLHRSTPSRPVKEDDTLYVNLEEIATLSPLGSKTIVQIKGSTSIIVVENIDYILNTGFIDRVIQWS